ncbi:MAG: DUF3800 domain-containing protein [Bacilli bacterium]
MESDFANGDFKTLRARVALILSRFRETRNSDLELQMRYWSIFHAGLYQYGDPVTPDLFKKMERLTNLARMRAKIQNEFELYMADETVRTERGRRSSSVTEDVVMDKPVGVPVTNVYCDETGKQSKLIGVGGLWFAEAHSAAKLWHLLTKWKKEEGIKASEFHFTAVSRGLMPYAKQFFEQALTLSGGFGLKAVFVERAGLVHSVDDTVRELHYQLVYRGLDHDRSTARSLFPRVVNVFKDADPGYDSLHLQRLRDDLIVSLDRRYGSDVTLDHLTATESSSSFAVQLADIFMASLNRALERRYTDAEPHFRDELADFVLERLGITIRDGVPITGDQDFVMIDILGQ